MATDERNDEGKHYLWEACFLSALQGCAANPNVYHEGAVKLAESIACEAVEVLERRRHA